MAIQAQKIAKMLEGKGFEVLLVKTNADFPSWLAFFQRIKGVRSILTLVFFLRDLSEKLKRSDLVYFLSGFFNFFFWVTFPALFLVKVHKKKIILSARGGGARAFFSKHHLLLRPIFKCFDNITVPSEFLKIVFSEFYNIHPIIIPNIADLKQFRFRERIPVGPRLLVTRSLEDIYNVSCVIRAFKEVCDIYPNSKLGIVGDGTQRISLESMVSDLGLSESVIFYGRVNHEAIQKLYDDYDIFVNASNVDNLPGTILEAFASGLPVVSSNAGGIPFMVQQNITGLLVEKNDHTTLASKVIELLENPQLASQLARNAFSECRKYSPEYVSSLLVPFLEYHLQRQEKTSSS
jgi:glycosyltransferase involved in cell wall biosynthesis